MRCLENDLDQLAANESNVNKKTLIDNAQLPFLHIDPSGRLNVLI